MRPLRTISLIRLMRRHKLRKALKRLRYGSHFLCSLYPQKRVDHYLDQLSTLQDALGLLNDLATAQHSLDELAQSGFRHEADLVAAARRDREKKALRHLVPAWRELRRLEPYWA